MMEDILPLEDVEKVPGIGMWVQFENPVEILTNRVPGDGQLVDSPIEKCLSVTSADWIIGHGTHTNGRYAVLKEGTDCGTRQNTKNLMCCYGDEKEEATRMLLAKMAVQIEKVYFEYSINPHSGEVVDEAPHFEAKDLSTPGDNR